jgi:hypothetical protein
MQKWKCLTSNKSFSINSSIIVSVYCVKLFIKCFVLLLNFKKTNPAEATKPNSLDNAANNAVKKVTKLPKFYEKSCKFLFTDSSEKQKKFIQDCLNILNDAEGKLPDFE